MVRPSNTPLSGWGGYMRMQFSALCMGEPENAVRADAQGLGHAYPLCKGNLLIRLSRLVRANLDSDFPVEALQKIQQFVGREPAVMAVHQMGHLRLRNAKELRDLPLFELSRLDDFIDAEADLRPRKKLKQREIAKLLGIA